MSLDLEILYKINEILHCTVESNNEKNFQEIDNLINQLNKNQNETSSIRNTHGFIEQSTGDYNRPSPDCALIDFNISWKYCEDKNAVYLLENQINFSIATNEIKNLKIDSFSVKWILEYKEILFRLYNDQSSLEDSKTKINDKLTYLISNKSKVDIFTRKDQLFKNLRCMIKKIETATDIQWILITDKSLNGGMFEAIIVLYEELPEFLTLLLKLKIKIEEYLYFENQKNEVKIRILNEISEYCAELIKSRNIMKNDEFEILSRLKEINTGDEEFSKLLMLEKDCMNAYLSRFLIELNEIIFYKEIQKLERNKESVFKYLFEYTCIVNENEDLNNSHFLSKLVSDYENKMEKRQCLLKCDLKLVSEMIDLINGNQNIISTCMKLGEMMLKITWNESDKICIRNKHGFYNKHKMANNEENVMGAKINFELFAHLVELDSNIEIKKLIIKNSTLIEKELKKLELKLQFILDESSSNGTVVDVKLELLENVCAYIHDIITIKKISDYLADYKSAVLNETFDLNNVTWRYHIGYIFVQIGELSKQISKQLKGDYMLKVLFKILYNFRKVIKGHPASIKESITTEKAQVFIQINNKMDKIKDKLRGLLEIIIINLREDINFEKIRTYHKINRSKDKYNLTAFEVQYFHQLISIINECLMKESNNVNGSAYDAFVSYEPALDKLFSTSEDLNTLHETGLSKLPLNSINIEFLRQIELNVKKGKSFKIGMFNFDMKKLEILNRMHLYIFRIINVVSYDLKIGDLYARIAKNQNFNEIKKIKRIIRRLCQTKTELCNFAFTLATFLSATNSDESVMGETFYLIICLHFWNMNAADKSVVMRFVDSSEMTFGNLLKLIELNGKSKPLERAKLDNYFQYLNKSGFLHEQFKLLDKFESEKEASIFSYNAVKMSIGIVGQCVKELCFDYNYSTYTAEFRKKNEAFIDATKKTINLRNLIMHAKNNAEVVRDVKIEDWNEQLTGFGFMHLDDNELSIRVQIRNKLVFETLVIRIQKLMSLNNVQQFENCKLYYENSKTLQTFINNDKLTGDNYLKRGICRSYLHAVYQLKKYEDVRKLFYSCVSYLKICSINDAEMNHSIQEELSKMTNENPNLLCFLNKFTDETFLWNKIALLGKYLEEKEYEKLHRLSDEVIIEAIDCNKIDELYTAYNFKVQYYFLMNNPLGMTDYINKSVELRVDDSKKHLFVHIAENQLGHLNSKVKKIIIYLKLTENLELLESYENVNAGLCKLKATFPYKMTSKMILISLKELSWDAVNAIHKEIAFNKKLKDDIEYTLNECEIHFKYHQDKFTYEIKEYMAFLYEYVFNFPKAFEYYGRFKEIEKESLTCYSFIYRFEKIFMTAATDADDEIYKLFHELTDRFNDYLSIDQKKFNELIKSMKVFEEMINLKYENKEALMIRKLNIFNLSISKICDKKAFMY